MLLFQAAPVGFDKKKRPTPDIRWAQQPDKQPCGGITQCQVPLSYSGWYFRLSCGRPGFNSRPRSNCPTPPSACHTARLTENKRLAGHPALKDMRCALCAHDGNRRAVVSMSGFRRAVGRTRSWQACDGCRSRRSWHRGACLALRPAEGVHPPGTALAGDRRRVL